MNIVGSTSKAVPPPSSLPFPEYDLKIEPEDYSEPASPEKTETERMREYDDYMRSAGDSLAAGSKVDSDLEKMAQGREDRQFEKFKTRIGHEPEQVLCVC